MATKQQQQANSPRQGTISIDAQNIMPVIKRWLYSDKDIFLREIVSNGVDAITKLKMVQGTPEGEELSVMVTLDKEKGEIRVSDNGIGMTAQEVDQYINQVAFSSAEEFLKNYTGEDASASSAIWSGVLFCLHGSRPRHHRFALLSGGHAAGALDQ